MAKAISAIPGAVYTPVFKIHPSPAWEGRKIGKAERAKLPEAFSGVLPASDVAGLVDHDDRVLWGLELGRRFRDSIRRPIGGVPVPPWQFGELLSQAAALSERGRRYRELTAAIHRGLYHGRPELPEDREPRTGIVWAAGSFLPLAGKNPKPFPKELSGFWMLLNRITTYFIGEEYPVFGDDAPNAPELAADRWGAVQRMLDQGTDRRGLYRKYVVGLTPGYHSHRVLGGVQLPGKPRPWVQNSREHYIARRAGQRVAGFAQYNFRVWNSWAEVMADSVSAIARGAERLSAPA